MHIDTPKLARAITIACAELDLRQVAAAEGEIGRLGARRLVLRIEPAGADWVRGEIPLLPGAEGIVSEGKGEAAGIRSRSTPAATATPAASCCSRSS
jgi:hypothetical protein